MASASTALRGAKAWLAVLPFALVIGLALLPHIGVVLLSISRDWYGTILPRGSRWSTSARRLGHELTVPSIRNSLRYAGVAMLVDLVLGVAIAYIAVRSSGAAGR